MATVIIQCDRCGEEADTMALKAWHSRAIANARAMGWTCDDVSVVKNRVDLCPRCSQPINDPKSGLMSV